MEGVLAVGGLEAFGILRAGDHKRGFSVDGISSNRAESFFSRIRRGEYGSYHHLGQVWLDFYAGEMTWHENHRRMPNKTAMQWLLTAALAHPISRVLKGYCQHWEVPDRELERKEVRWRRVFSRVWERGLPDRVQFAT